MSPKWYDQKKQFRAFKARVEQLPPPYQTTVEALLHYMNRLGGMDDADSILTMLDDLADLFDRAATDGTPVRAVVGADPVQFTEAFLSNYPSGRWITKERERLTRAVEVAEQQQAEGAG